MTLALLLLALRPACARPVIARQEGGRWLLENARLRVSVEPAPGRIAVRDKKSGYEWRQPGTAGEGSARVVFRQITTPPAMDGSLTEWRGAPTVRLTSRMTTTDARKVDSDADASAEVWGAWDNSRLYLAARVRDDAMKFAPPGQAEWWESDSLECWVGGRQVGLRLNPSGSEARTLDGPLPGAQVVCRVIPGGYAVEAALPWQAFTDAPARRPGAAFRFAVGLNDADATGRREGQLYYPATWAHSQPATFAGAMLADPTGALPAVSGQAADRFRRVRRIPSGLAFEADFGSTKGKPNTVTVSLRLSPDAADLSVEADVADRRAERGDFPFLEPFLLDTRQGMLAVADYCDGHLYPLDMDPFPRTWFDGGRLDLPFVGVCDLKQGQGYALILETSDDAWVQCRPFTVGARRLYAPQVGWLASKGTFGHPRRLLYRFSPSGGYVALCKSLRRWMQARGLVVPFREKVKRNPNIRRLFGAVDVWGDASLKFAREARAAGVEKMLIHGRSTPTEMKAVNALGYLTSEYDNYTDILPVEAGKQPDSSHDRLPEAAVLNANGTRMAAWLTYDKKTQYMKRCPALWVPTANRVIPNMLREWPFLGRFIDVTTAEALYECFDPAHPLTKAQKRECGENLLAAVRSNRLVVGGEHGIWWGAPHQDYVEGMMSGNRFAWPAGHLIHPKDRQETFSGPYGTETWEIYDRWSMGHEWRAPLWELVFHDCVVPTWYWGDSSDYLLDADPGNQAKKDAFNILYGTMPMLWADGGGAWRKDRAAFLRTYRNVCRLHEAVADQEMLSHEYLTPDHALQRTRFADGTTCVVNFGATPRTVTLAGKAYRLPQNGWAVKGPKIVQSRALVEDRVETLIRQKGYQAAERAGEVVTARAVRTNCIRLDTAGGWRFFHIYPQEIQPGWDLAGTRAFALDAEGRRIRQLSFRRFSSDLRLMGGYQTASVEIITGREARAADMQVDSISINPGAPRQGQPLTVRVAVRNAGGSPARNVAVALYADAVRPDRRLATISVSRLASGGVFRPTVVLDSTSLDGPRRLIAIASTTSPELCARNNQTEQVVRITPDFARWPQRRMLRVNAGDVDREGAVAEYRLEDTTLNPASVRVALCDSQGRPSVMVPAQCARRSPGVWTICFVLPGFMPAHNTRRMALLSAPLGGPKFLPTGGSMWNAATQTLAAPLYSVRFVNGMLADLGPGGKPCISHLMYSSAQTGWTEEPGTVRRFEALEDGPVRTVIRVRKALQAGVITEKTFAFYPHHFDLSGTASMNLGVFSRAYYLRPGRYEDSGGFRAMVDGQGDAEEVSNRARNPQWYAVYADDWAMACLALSPMSDITYWDNSGAWGGIGFNTGATEAIRMRYVFHPGAKSAAFAADDYRRLTAPVQVVQEP